MSHNNYLIIFFNQKKSSRVFDRKVVTRIFDIQQTVYTVYRCQVLFFLNAYVYRDWLKLGVFIGIFLNPYHVILLVVY